MSQLNGAAQGCSSPSNMKYFWTSTSWSDSLEVIIIKEKLHLLLNKFTVGIIKKR